MVVEAVLSVGAIYALVPIVIIIILIAAAVGLTRGSDLFAVFGIGTLLGLRGTIGAGSAGKGMSRGPTIPKSTLKDFKGQGAKVGAGARGVQKYRKGQADMGRKLDAARGAAGSSAVGSAGGSGNWKLDDATTTAITKKLVEPPPKFVKTAVPIVPGFVSKVKKQKPQTKLRAIGRIISSRMPLSKGVIFETKSKGYTKDGKQLPLVRIYIPGLRTTLRAARALPKFPSWTASFFLTKRRADSLPNRPANQNTRLGRWFGRQRQASWEFKANRANRRGESRTGREMDRYYRKLDRELRPSLFGNRANSGRISPRDYILIKAGIAAGTAGAAGSSSGTPPSGSQSSATQPPPPDPSSPWQQKVGGVHGPHAKKINDAYQKAWDAFNNKDWKGMRDELKNARRASIRSAILQTTPGYGLLLWWKGRPKDNKGEGSPKPTSESRQGERHGEEHVGKEQEKAQKEEEERKRIQKEKEEEERMHSEGKKR